MMNPARTGRSFLGSKDGLELLIFRRTLWLLPPQKPFWIADCLIRVPRRPPTFVALIHKKIAAAVSGRARSVCHHHFQTFTEYGEGGGRGHHLTLNWTIEAGRVVSVTPMTQVFLRSLIKLANLKLGEDQQAYLDLYGHTRRQDASGGQAGQANPRRGTGVASLAQHQRIQVGVRFSELPEATQTAGWKVLDTVYDRLDPWLGCGGPRLVLKRKTFSSVEDGLAFRPNAYRIEGEISHSILSMPGRGQPRAHAVPGRGRLWSRGPELDSSGLRQFSVASCGPLRAPCCFRALMEVQATLSP